MLVQNLQILVSIGHCNVVRNFLPWPPLPPAGVVGGVQGAVGAVLIAPVIP
jgi:hypothetical protein